MPKQTNPTNPQAPIGGRFIVTEQREFHVGARMVARYLVGHGYSVTDLNCVFVGEMIAEGVAKLTAIGAPQRAGGQITT